MEDQYIRRIGEGIYMTELDGPRNKIRQLKQTLDTYIDMVIEDLEYSENSIENIRECNRKMELFVHIIEKLNEFIQRDASSS